MEGIVYVRLNNAVFSGVPEGGRMKEQSENEWNENNEELSAKEIAELLEEENLSEEELNGVLKSVKIFCKVAYELFAAQQNNQECEIINLKKEVLNEELKEAA